MGISDGNLYELAIPNREVRNIIMNRIMIRFKAEVNKDGDTLRKFCDELSEGKPEVGEQIFREYMKKTISVRDTFVKKPLKEKFYHGILLGILSFKDSWLVRSNRESGNGFSDIMIQMDDSDVGIVIEVKYVENGDMEKECQKAIQQIDDTKYTEFLHEEGIYKILKYGIACRKKDCRVLMEKEELRLESI